MAISATIITLNEEQNIGECITSLKEVSGDIIVVDSGSHDKTAELASNAGASVIHQPYLGDGPQRITAAQYAKNDWILCLDADERLTTAAAAEINGLSLTNPDLVYSFRRRNFVGNHWIKAAGFYPDYVIRLYNRRKSGYSNRRGHARVEGGKKINCDGHIQHYTYKDYSDWVKRINELSTRDAWAKKAEGKSSTPTGAIIRGGFAFFRKLFLKGGIVQGTDGWLISITTAFRVYLKYLKLSELDREKPNDQD